MRNMKILIVILLSTGLLSACTNVAVENGEPRWDFDHNVQYKQTKLEGQKYHLQVVPNSDARFSRLATFLLRRSKDICHEYGYSIEILGGVQGFNEKIGAPNKIMRSLEANIECLK